MEPRGGSRHRHHGTNRSTPRSRAASLLRVHATRITLMASGALRVPGEKISMGQRRGMAPIATPRFLLIDSMLHRGPKGPRACKSPIAAPPSWFARGGKQQRHQPPQPPQQPLKERQLAPPGVHNEDGAPKVVALKHWLQGGTLHLSQIFNPSHTNCWRIT